MRVICGNYLDVLPTLETGSVNCVVTSPPYFSLLDYDHADQLGHEATPAEYVQKVVGAFRMVRRVLDDRGTVWLNLGDSYSMRGKGGGKSGGKERKIMNASLRRTPTYPDKPKCLLGIPWRVALALQDDGWFLRCDVIWNKPNKKPEPVKDRPTRSHEYLFLLSKSRHYHYDRDAIAEPAKGTGGGACFGKQKVSAVGTGTQARTYSRPEYATRNKRSVWSINTKGYPGAHFATFPPKLVEPCVLAGCPAGGVVLDPFAGSGTVGEVCILHGRDAVLIELNPDYIPLIEDRLENARKFAAERLFA